MLRGDNGSGKTTLLNIMSGFTKPQFGRVLVDQTVVSGKGPSRSARLGVVRGFQAPALCDDLKVWENISLPLFRGFWSSTIHLRERAAASLGQAGAADLLDRSPGELSFGERRLVELLRIDTSVSHNHPLLVLLDEPLSGLDPGRRETALGILDRIAAHGTLTVVVEHDREMCSLIGKAREVALKELNGQCELVEVTISSFVP